MASASSNEKVGVYESVAGALDLTNLAKDGCDAWTRYWQLKDQKSREM